MKANQTGTRIIITTEHKYKHKRKMKKSLKSLIENKSISNVYNNTEVRQRNACIADTSKANNGYYTSYPSPAGRALLRESSVHGKRLTAAISFSLLNLVCFAMVDEMLSHLVALKAKQKP